MDRNVATLRVVGAAPKGLVPSIARYRARRLTRRAEVRRKLELGGERESGPARHRAHEGGGEGPSRATGEGQRQHRAPRRLRRFRLLRGQEKALVYRRRPALRGGEERRAQLCRLRSRVQRGLFDSFCYFLVENEPRCG